MRPPTCSRGRATVRPMDANPTRRATSSTMSISRSRSGRNVGAIAVMSSPPPSTSMPNGRSASRISVSRSSVPRTPFTLLVRTWMRARSTGWGYSSTASPATFASATSAKSSMARSACSATPLGSMPRSKRALDSERSLRRFDVRAMPIRSKYADSSRISDVSSETSDVPPPMTPAIACGAPVGVADEEVLLGERAIHAVERRDVLAVVRPAARGSRGPPGARGRRHGAAGCARAARSW